MNAVYLKCSSRVKRKVVYYGHIREHLQSDEL